jgi:WD40 repeat protein
VGATYGSVQVCCQTQDRVRDVLEDLSAKRKGRFWLGPALGRWTGVYPVLHGMDPSVARDLSRRLGGEVFSLVVHDDDAFQYEYYRDGKRVDQYWSRPDYLGTPTEAARKAVRGRPEKFAHLAADPERFAQFQGRIAEQAKRPAVFASELLVAFASALGIANVQTSYEYLSDGENDVDGWDQFVHVPDLRTEETRARNADAAHQGEVRRLIREGLLLAERGGRRGRDVPFLHWCSGPQGAGFLLVAEPPEFSTREPVPMEQIGPPWSAGPKPTGLMLDPTLKTLVSSPSGRFVAVWFLNSDPSASVWDVADRQCLVKLARGWHLPHHFTFLPDESAIVCSCAGMSGQLTIVPLGPGESRSIPWPVSLTMAAVHPSGRAVVFVDQRNRLSVLDLPRGQIDRTLFVGGIGLPLGAKLLLGNDYPRDWLTMPLDAIEGLVRRKRDEFAEAHRKTVRGRSTEGAGSTKGEFPSQSDELGRELIEALASPARIGAVECEALEALAGAREPGWLEQKARSRESVNQIAFDPSGERLFAATWGGLRVYLWRDCIEASGLMPPPVLAIDADELVHETADGLLDVGGAVTAFCHDPNRDWLLFGGSDGRARYLDLATGQTGSLLDPPGLRPIRRLALSRDRTVLAMACGTDMIEDGSARPMRSSAAVQFWNYPAVCDRAVDIH